MVLLSATIRFLQEFRSQKAADKLKAMVRTTASVFRIDGFVHETKNVTNLNRNYTTEIPIEELVPGDIISLSAGDIVPADVRILSAKDLFVNQSSLTGEALPVEKYENCYHTENKHILPKNMKKITIRSIWKTFALWVQILLAVAQKLLLFQLVRIRISAL